MAACLLPWNTLHASQCWPYTAYIEADVAGCVLQLSCNIQEHASNSQLPQFNLDLVLVDHFLAAELLITLPCCAAPLDSCVCHELHVKLYAYRFQFRVKVRGGKHVL